MQKVANGVMSVSQTYLTFPTAPHAGQVGFICLSALISDALLGTTTALLLNPEMV
jgi:hypothetical protein